MVAECALVSEKEWRLCASEFKFVFLQIAGSLPNLNAYSDPCTLMWLPTLSMDMVYSKLHLLIDNKCSHTMTMVRPSA